MSAKQIIRRKEPILHELKVDWDDEASLIKLIAEHPVLLERPIIVHGSKAVVADQPNASMSCFDRAATIGRDDHASQEFVMTTSDPTCWLRTSATKTTGLSVSFEDIGRAHAAIRDQIHKTPVLTCQSIDNEVGAKIFFKCENLQRIGAFKIRGALNAVSKLSPEQLARGVVTHSSGNHASALSLAAHSKSIPAYIVMPNNSAKPKIAAVERYGGKITFCEPTVASRESTAAAIQQETGATMVHPYDDLAIIAGQGTCGVELFRQMTSLDCLLVPTGGGGLTSGCAIAANYLAPNVKVFGCEPTWANDALRSMVTHSIAPVLRTDTIADGLRTSLGKLTFPILSALLAGVVTASEQNMKRAMRMIWERMKLVIEPSSAVPLACMLEHPDLFRGQRVGIVLSGGNVDLDGVSWT